MLIFGGASEGLEIADAANDIFIFLFGYKDEKGQVLDSEPWLFDKSLLLLKEILVSNSKV